MAERAWLAARFESNRTHLHAVAYRMLGSRSDAEDAVQESWLRLCRSETTAVDNLTGWLTTVVARVCLDMLRARKSRREESLDDAPVSAAVIEPERDAQLADSIGLAMLVVLDALAPAERVAFVLHDMFGLPFDDIAPIVGRTPTAARQLASRARRRVRGATTVEDVDVARQRQVVDAFLAASRGGDFAALLALLDPDVVLRADHVAVAMGAAAEARGAAAVADTFAGRARGARPALVSGNTGLVWAAGGRPRVVFAFTIARGKIVAIDLIADAERFAELNIEMLNDS